ncbi:MAG: hypothetical protein ACKPA8_09690, partial [Dolichospermum sp.]
VNLLFLVEGGKTEPKVYKAWLQHLFPSLTFVVRPEDMTINTCRIIAGNGYPSMVDRQKKNPEVSRLEACLIDIVKFGNVNHFFICIDSEENSYTDRFHEVKSKLDDLKSGCNIDSSKTEIHIIIQHCCFETWALGNAEIPNEYSSIVSSTVLSDFQAYYDILVNDPEEMSSCPPGYIFRTKAKFHERYLKEYLQQFGLSYSKKDPKVVEGKKYLDALKKRWELMNHLSSLKLLLDIWSRIETL